ncbi:hypothetical protein HZS_7127 [Henneguya salminicola]|nr:hypothetical protein HZS_7127 [Henneguya salminicola]
MLLQCALVASFILSGTYDRLRRSSSRGSSRSQPESSDGRSRSQSPDRSRAQSLPYRPDRGSTELWPIDSLDQTPRESSGQDFLIFEGETILPMPNFAPDDTDTFIQYTLFCAKLMSEYIISSTKSPL